MSPSHARRMNLIALALLITALISFAAFHGLEFQIYVDPSMQVEDDNRGWRVWPELVDFVRDLDFSDPRDLIAWAGFLCATLLIAASPALIPVFRASRLAWWLAALVSGTAMLGLGGVLLLDPPDPSWSVPGPGYFCLLGALALNFIGLLFVRREVLPEPRIDLDV